VTATFSVLLVEDDPLTAQLLRERVSRNQSLDLAGEAATAWQAIDMARRVRPDLVLLDFTLPESVGQPESETAGFDVWRVLYELENVPDVIAVTGAREMCSVVRAQKFGVFDYVVKPFTPATIDAKLAAYTGCRRSRIPAQQRVNQSTVDTYLNRLRRSGSLPKGLDHKTMDSVVAVLQAAEGPLLACEIGDRVGVNRETANKYLICLCSQGIAARIRRYGGLGQPPFLYTVAAIWKSEPEGAPTPS
jgi:response regulator of citrate/malate metabolism